MKYKAIQPCIELAPFIHNFWELKGEETDGQWERNFPDGCSGLVINLGDTCQTDNGSVSMAHGKTYVVGAMTSFKDSFIHAGTHLSGVCLKPAAFSNFYRYAAQHELTDNTIEFDKPLSFDVKRMIASPATYLNRFFIDRLSNTPCELQPVIEAIHRSNGQLSINEIAKRHFITVRQLERKFKTQVGITPKEYSNIVRFQNALSLIQNPIGERGLSDIAFDCGFYDHAHLTNEIKKNTGLAPSQL